MGGILASTNSVGWERSLSLHMFPTLYFPKLKGDFKALRCGGCFACNELQLVHIFLQ